MTHRDAKHVAKRACDATDANGVKVARSSNCHSKKDSKLTIRREQVLYGESSGSTPQWSESSEAVRVLQDSMADDDDCAMAQPPPGTETPPPALCVPAGGIAAITGEFTTLLVCELPCSP